jgi:hypothetical protein
MGAWNETLVGNDSVQDLIDHCKDGELALIKIQRDAERESGDEAEDLKYLEPEDEQPNAECEHRLDFLGVIYSLLENRDTKNWVSASHLNLALRFLKEVTHQRHLSRWKDPSKRLAALHEANVFFVGELALKTNKSS